MASPHERSKGIPAPSLKGRRILVVEDQSLIAMEIQVFLEKNGATVVGPIGRLAHALSAAEKENLEAALLDVDLNGEECWPVADALARRNGVNRRLYASAVRLSACGHRENRREFARICSGKLA